MSEKVEQLLAEGLVVDDFVQILNHTCYLRTEEDGSDVFVCNFCGKRKKYLGNMVRHVGLKHGHKTIPDADPTQ